MGTPPRLRHVTKAKPTLIGMLFAQGSPNRYAVKSKTCSSQGQGTSPWARCQVQGMQQPRPRQPPLGTQLRTRHAAKAKAVKAKTCSSQGQGMKPPRPRHVAMGTLPRPRQPHRHAAKAKACSSQGKAHQHGNAAKAKACMLF
nr:hypothetical protein CFP56_54109 [Quercus suber]